MDEPTEVSHAEDERSLVFIDPSPEERAHVESLGEELGRPIWAVDPAEFSAEMIDSLAEAAAVVVAWNLGGRPGLDLVETLSRDPRLREIPIALSADAPTPALVRAAWRAGARSFLLRPYEPGELAARLLGGSAPEAPSSDAAGGAEPSSRDAGAGDDASPAPDSPEGGADGSAAGGEAPAS